MMFWDSSAILPLCLSEPHSKAVRKVLRKDPWMVVWWSSIVECSSAFARLRREGTLTVEQEDRVKQFVFSLSSSWTEMQPNHEIRSIAVQLHLTHTLRAADSLQLASALLWADKAPDGHRFVCLDARLREAARKEGFALSPFEI